MDGAGRTDSVFDAQRLAFVAVVAAVAVLADVAFFGLFGIESSAQAIAQFVTITVGAYIGLTIVDVAIDADEE